MMKKQIFLCVWVALILLTIAFIFYNSAQTVPKSNEVATSVAETIAPISKNEYDTPADWRAFVLQVRKAAHAVEFFLLGTELFVLFFLFRKPRGIQTFWNVLSAPVVIAVADESIQILSGRGPKVQDVLLDFCGAAAAVALCSVLYFSVRALVHRSQKKKNAHTVC